jgi:hypothetical protein
MMRFRHYFPLNHERYSDPAFYVVLVLALLSQLVQVLYDCPPACKKIISAVLLCRVLVDYKNLLHVAYRYFVLEYGRPGTGYILKRSYKNERRERNDIFLHLHHHIFTITYSDN